MNFRRIFYLLWFVVPTTFLLSAPCFGAAALTSAASRTSSALLQRDSPGWSVGAHLSRKKINPHSELQARTGSLVTIPHRRVHRRYGIETPALRMDPFLVQVADLIDTHPQVRSGARFHSHGRSPPIPRTDSRG
jgi:hypothetical protein